MQVNMLAEDGLKKTLQCVIPAQEVNAAMERELKRIGQTVKIAGFRPGFVPLKILQQRYGKAVQGDVIRNLVTDGVTSAITDKGLRPALSPEVENQQYQDGGELRFDVKLEVLPELPDVGLSDIALDKEVFEIGEDDIDEGLNRLAERSPKAVALPEDTAAKSGHVVTMDFRGYVGGEVFEGGTADRFNVEIGSGRLIAGFEEQLIGAKAAESRDVRVTFPLEYFNQELAGKDALFEVKIREVAELQTPEINDEFAKSKGFSDIRALREAVRDQLMKDFSAIVRTRLKKQLFDVLEERCDFAVPQGMADLEFNSIWQRLQVARQQGDETVAAKSDDELRAEYRAIAERRVRLGILLAEIARKEKLQVTREELSRALIQHASQYPGQEQRVMEYYRQNPERLDELRGPILEEKAVDWILAKVKFSEKKVNPAELFDAEEEDEDTPKAEKQDAAKAKKEAAPAKKSPASKAKKAEDAEEEPKAEKPKVPRKKATKSE